MTAKFGHMGYPGILAIGSNSALKTAELPAPI